MKNTTVTELAHTADATIVDVREPDEFAAGHVPGGTNIPLNQLADRIGELPDDTPIHVICQSGGRSAKATELLTGRGIDAINVEGGTSAWIAAGLPTEQF